jgi:dienelactone hydrolase
MKRKSLIIWFIILAPIIAIIGFSIWAYTPLGPMPEALAAMEQSNDVQVKVDRWVVFEPLEENIDIGVIIYPGGRVEPRSYAPMARELAENGYLAVITPMPFNLAIFGWQSAGEVAKEFPEITTWVVAGHSLGGSMAARYAAMHPEIVDGLVLWAAYPAAGDDLSTNSLQSVTIFGTEDGLISTGEIEDSLVLLPESTARVEIEGGNHAQFGWYGEQPGDNPARISREQQQQVILQSMLEILDNFK